MRNHPPRAFPDHSLSAAVGWVAVFILTVITSTHGGIFGAPQTIRSGQSPEAWVRTADVDLDGDGDVVYSPSAGKLDLLRRNADGTWTTVPLITSGVLRVLNAVVADFDLNGLPDVAAYVQRNASETGILTLRQSSGGVFNPDNIVYVDAGSVPAALAPLRVADVDGDGRQDLVLAWKNGPSSSNQGRVGWMRYVGGATLFAAPDALFLLGLDEPCDVLPADFDRDGDIDIAVADNAAGHVRICPGPDFTPATVLELPSTPRHLELVDDNKDGWLDLLIAHAALGTGPGLGLRVYNGGPGGFQSDVFDYYSSISLTAYSSLAVADMNLDGRTDAVLGGSSSVPVLLARDGPFSDLDFSPPVTQPSGAVSCYDDDRDGDADVIAGTATGLVRIPNLTPHRLLTDETTSIHSAAGTSAAGNAGYVTGDFNRDGRGDVAAATASDGNIRVFLNSGGTALTSVLVANNPNCRWLTAADFDGDGDLDLAAPSITTGRVVWYQNNGTGSAWTSAVIGYAVNAPASISAGDLNLDGRPDLVTISATGGAVHQLINGGGGAWTGSVLAGLASAYRVEIADVVAGGRPEVLVQHGSGGAVTMFRFTLFLWAESVLLPARSGTGGEGMAMGDLDGNGLMDVAQGFGRQVNAVMQTSPGTFGPSTYLGSEIEFFGYQTGVVRSVRMADLDADGITECVGVFERGLGVFSLDRPQRGHRDAVLLARNTTELQSDAVFVRFDNDALPDAVHHSTTGARLSVDLTAAPVVTLDAVPAWAAAGTMNYPVQENVSILLHRIKATNWSWPGDLPVNLTGLNVKFRRDNAALTPFDQNLLSLFYANFSLWEDLGQPGVPEIGTFDPHVSGLAPGAPDAAGTALLTLATPAAFNPGSQRDFFLAATTGTPYLGWGFRVELENGRSGDSAHYPGNVGNTFFPVPAGTTSTAARFIASPITPRQSWRFSHWKTPANMGAAADYADPDGDGMPNLLEYALGQNPKVASRARMEVQVIDSRCYVSIWSVPAQADVSLTLLASPDLKVWHERGSRPASGTFWSKIRPADDIFAGNPDGSLLQQILSTPRLPGGREFYHLEAREVSP